MVDSDLEALVERARKAVISGSLSEGVVYADELLKWGGEWRRWGLLLGAMAYTNGDDSLPRDMDKAVSRFTEYAVDAVIADPWLFLAGALMTQGGESAFARAAKALDAAAEFGWSPGMDLGWARYYEECPEPDLARSINLYLSAARAGRFMGMFGAARVLRRTGRPFAALGLDVVRIATGPIIALLIGRKATRYF